MRDLDEHRPAQVVMLFLVIAVCLSFCGCATVRSYDRVGMGAKVEIPAGVVGDWFSVKFEAWVGAERGPRRVHGDEPGDAFTFPESFEE